MNTTTKTHDEIYLDVARAILEYGEERPDRTGTGVISLFSPSKMRFDLTKGFPLLTTKKVAVNSMVKELLWFLSGSTHIKPLVDQKVKIWDGDAYRHYTSMLMGDTAPTKEWFIELIRGHKQPHKQMGELGPVYGKQWRAFPKPDGGEVDQIKELINSIKENPTSRRHIVSAWNPGQLDEMALPPCHIFFQAYVSNDGGLSLQMYQRSADWFLGMPFNIASYSLLTHMIAQVTGLYAKEFILVPGDGHIYLNHVEQIQEQMSREPKDYPTLKLNPDITDIDDFTFEDITFEGYDPHPAIKGDVSNG